MNGYINIYGTTAGPIQIGPSSTWITKTFNTVGYKNNRSEVHHISFSLSKESNQKDTSLLSLVRGKTPLIGGYYENDSATGEQRYITHCDPNSFVTAEWVAGFATLKPGDQVLDLSKFVSFDDFNLFKSDVNIQFNNLNNKIDSNYNALSDKILINVKDITQLNSSLNNLKNDYNNYVNDPFPNGVIIDCGDATGEWE